ncbi:MAG: AraC family transcriptional regulator [Planctomycetota bacterium]
MLVYIQEHLDADPSLEELAAVAHFSPYHFHRIFKSMMGESVKEHLRRLRLERAAHQLKFSERIVIDLAEEAGYLSHEAFTRAFRSMFAETPSRFRQIQSALPYPQVVSDVHYQPDAQVRDFNVNSSEQAQQSVRIEELASKPVLFMRHHGPYPEVGSTWQKLMAWAGPRGLVGPGMTLLGIAYDDPEITPPEKIRYDACLMLAQELEPEGDIGCQWLTGGRYASTPHVGPYENLGATYQRLCAWLIEKGLELRSAPVLEIYRNSPQTTAPKDLYTDIYMPLEGKGNEEVGQERKA